MDKTNTDHLDKVICDLREINRLNSEAGARLAKELERLDAAVDKLAAAFARICTQENANG